MIGRKKDKREGRNRGEEHTNKDGNDKKDRIKEKSLIPEIFDIPGSAIMGIAHIEMAGNREAVIDGIQGVLEYDENIIRLATAKMIIKFTGRSLQIKTLTHDSAVVSGLITGVEFIT